MTQLTGSQSDAQFASCVGFALLVRASHFLNVSRVPLSCFPSTFMLHWKDKCCVDVIASVIINVLTAVLTGAHFIVCLNNSLSTQKWRVRVCDSSLLGLPLSPLWSPWLRVESN